MAVTTRVLSVDPDRPDPAALDEAAAVLNSGGLVAFATETVYGLGAVATDPAAVARIFEAKGRPAFNPLIVHVAAIGQARECTREWPPAAERLAERFWPGPLTLVLPRSPIIPDVVAGGRPTVAVRLPAPAVARGLIERTGRPLAAPSANRSNQVSPTRAEHVLAGLAGRIELVLDSGPTAFGLESTVLDLTRSPARLLRPGPIGPEAIAARLDGIDRVEIGPAGEGSGAIASPGMLPVHYAPRTPAFRVETTEALASVAGPGRWALLVVGPADPARLPADVERVHLPDPASAAAGLYDALHDLDARRLDRIVILMPPDRPEWHAVRDRLTRASRPCEPMG